MGSMGYFSKLHQGDVGALDIGMVIAAACR
jgi:hypothetical protein